MLDISSLKYLYKENSIGCEGAHDLSEALRENNSITTLHLQSTQRCKIILIIMYQENHIGNEGASYLLDAWKDSSSLSILKLQGKILRQIYIYYLFYW
jgi:hypothetical protein